MGSALNIGEATVQHSWHRSPIEKFFVGWWQSERVWTLREGGSPELLWISDDHEQAPGFAGIEALGRPMTLSIWVSALTVSMDLLCNEPLSLRLHLPNLVGHRTIFIFITQEEHVSYKCEPYHMNSVNFILKGRLLHNNHYVNIFPT